MSTVTPRTQTQGLPANGVTAGAIQVTGTALRISARITSGNGPQTLALIRMNTGTGNWYRVTDINGSSLEWTLPGLGDSNQGNADLAVTLPAEGAAEYYQLLVESPSAFPGTAEIESLSAPAAAGGTVPQARTITTANGLLIGGGTSADLSADRALSVVSLTLDKEVAHSISVVASTTAATAGGALSEVAGAGSTSGAGGAWSGAGGAGGATGTGGAASVTGGAGGATSGVGGAASIRGGVGTAGNSAGGALSAAGGAGQGSAAGGAAAVVGGVGGATGAGGAASIKGGAGGATSGTGGALALAGGAGSAGNADGGAVSIDGGAKNGSGADGLINIGVNAGSFVKFGAKIQASASAFAITDPGNAGAIPVTANGVCNITSGGAETRTLAIPTFVGQELLICFDTDGGDCVITVASSFNQTGNNTITLNDAGDSVLLKGRTVGGTRKWVLIVNDGSSLSTV